MDSYILAMDQGTTSCRSILFDKTGNAIASSHKEFKQLYPRPGWVEHNPVEIFDTQYYTAQDVLHKTNICPEQIASIGITNQRETVVVWERDTGNPVYNAIVWQCRRTTQICDNYKKDKLEPLFKEKTGLVIDPYFSGTKIKWILDSDERLRLKARKGELLFGTIDSWLIYNLTGLHFTDTSNASRTQLYNINTGVWDREIMTILGIPDTMVPLQRHSSANFGKTKNDLFGREILVGGVAGDQQAALFGQACFETGDSKNTYGTGCFALVNTGHNKIESKNGLLTTLACELDNGLVYALEGSVFIAGAVIQWLRDELKIITNASETNDMAASIQDTGGVYIVPAFAGLGAPYWDPSARGIIVGLTRGSNRAHIVRAALESIAYQSADLIHALQEDSGKKIPELKVDGGATQNAFLMQFQADILGIPVVTSSTPDITALGAAYLAGLQVGFWNSTADIKKQWKEGKRYMPQMNDSQRETLIAGWKNAVAAAREYK
ncbi:MAG: glycerol kinase GlpK [Spirochaetales bacterium]|nr:glycerol kinase GlpK [Spirochaetales bacterium]